MHKQQKGFVSIIVASILMILLTLITIGLSRIMQREQRQSLDRQLSTQAFYAAETGVNDVQAKIQSKTLAIEEKKDCDVTNWPTDGANGVVDPSNPSIAYTCLIYDSTPSSLEFNNGSIKTQESRIFPVQSKNGGNINSIKFEWSGSGGVNKIQGANCTGTTPLAPANIGSVPILRIDLMRLPTTGSIVRQDLIDQTVTTYLYPHSELDACGNIKGDLSLYAGDLGGGQTKNGQLVNVDCRGAVNYGCSFEYTDMAGVGSLPPSNRYFVRLKSIYNDADVRVTSTATAAGVDFEFVGAQTVVDSTGIANDVLRRMKVYLSNSSSYPVPEFVFQSADGVCKQLNVAPGNVVSNNCF